MSALPSEEEIWRAIGKLKSGKAGVTPAFFLRWSRQYLLMDPVHTAWCECKFPKELSYAVLVPITKKGDLGKCDN